MRMIQLFFLKSLESMSVLQELQEKFENAQDLKLTRRSQKLAEKTPRLTLKWQKDRFPSRDPLFKLKKSKRQTKLL